jgi:hypothetical protein
METNSHARSALPTASVPEDTVFAKLVDYLTRRHEFAFSAYAQSGLRRRLRQALPTAY